MTAIFTKVYNTFIETGLLANMKGIHVKLLLALCKYMDEDGITFPSLEQLQKDIGASSPNHVQRYLTGKKDGLIHYEFNGNKIVELVEKRKSRKGLYNVYRVSPASCIGKFKDDTDINSSPVNFTGTIDKKVSVDSDKEVSMDSDNKVSGNKNHYNKNHYNKNHKQDIDQHKKENKDNTTNKDMDNNDKVNNSQVVSTVDKELNKDIAGAITVEKEEPKVIEPTPAYTVHTPQPVLDESTRRKADKVLSIYIELFNRRCADNGRSKIRKLAGDIELIAGSPLLNVDNPDYIRRAIQLALIDDDRHKRRTTLEDVINHTAPQFLDKAIDYVESIRQYQTRQLAGA